MGAFPQPLRIAQPGDLCILLEPGDPEEITALQQHQLALQRCYGGQVMEPVHITCQRFTLTNLQQFEALRDELNHLAARWQPSKISASGLLSLHSEYRRADIIKWKILLTDELASISSQFERILAAIGSTSLYPPGWVSTQVTALTGIDPGVSQDETDLHFPQPLFTPSILTLSRIYGPKEFEILEQISL